MIPSLVMLAAVCVVPYVNLHAETGVGDALGKNQKALDAVKGQVAAANNEAAQAKVASTEMVLLLTRNSPHRNKLTRHRLQ